MNSQLKIIDPNSDNRWDNFVYSTEQATIYHTSLWKSVIEKTYAYEPCYFINEENSNLISGAFPFFFVKSLITGKRFVSLPFSDYSGILVKSRAIHKPFLVAVLRYLQERKATKIMFKTKDTVDFSNDYHFEIDNHNLNHILELSTSPNELFAKFHKNNIQRNIKKAENSGIEIKSGQSEKDLKAFYKLYVKTRQKHGLIPQPYRFFRNIWVLFEPTNTVELLLAFENGQAIAGILNLSFRDTKYYLYGGSNYKLLQHKPNHLLLWTAIKNAYYQNFKYFDFGRTSADNIGLLEFKRRWATIESSIPYYSVRISKKASMSNNSKKFIPTWIYHLIKIMPATVLKIIGNQIYKHFG